MHFVTAVPCKFMTNETLTSLPGFPGPHQSTVTLILIVISVEGGSASSPFQSLLFKATSSASQVPWEAKSEMELICKSFIRGSFESSLEQGKRADLCR